MTKFIIDSRATSYEESGNDIHYGTKEILDLNNIPYSKRKATRVEKSDLDKYDYFICMDSSNVRNLSYILGDSSKISMLLDRDVADPWYTGIFKVTYDDINYDKQLNGYREFLEKKTGKRVECYLYSIIDSIYRMVK